MLCDGMKTFTTEEKLTNEITDRINLIQKWLFVEFILGYKVIQAVMLVGSNFRQLIDL